MVIVINDGIKFVLNYISCGIGLWASNMVTERSFFAVRGSLQNNYLNFSLPLIE